MFFTLTDILTVLWYDASTN